MELRSLRHFVALARAGSISSAALAEHISQPAFSRQMAALEDELGCQLYTRSKKGIRLTDDGATLYNYALAILSLADEAEERLTEPRDVVRGSMRIGCGDSMSFALVARAARRLAEAHPLVTFHYHMGTSAELLADLSKGFYDAVLECEVQKHVEFNIRELPVTDRWGVVVRADNPLAGLEAAAPADLVGHRLLVSRQALKAGAIERWAGDLFGQLRFTATFNLGLNVLTMVREGLGSVLGYYELLVDMLPDDLRVVPLEPAVVSHQAVLWRKGTPPPVTQAFLDELDAVCADTAGIASQP